MFCNPRNFGNSARPLCQTPEWPGICRGAYWHLAAHMAKRPIHHWVEGVMHRQPVGQLRHRWGEQIGDALPLRRAGSLHITVTIVMMSAAQEQKKKAGSLHIPRRIGTTCAWLCLGSPPACRKAGFLGTEATVTPKQHRVEQNFTKSLLYCIHSARFCASICEWLDAILELTCGFKLLFSQQNLTGNDGPGTPARLTQ